MNPSQNDSAVQAAPAGKGAVHTTARHFRFRYRSPDHFVEIFRTYYGPILKAFASLDASAQAALRRGLVEFQTANNIAGTPGTTEVAAEYLEVIAVRS